MIIFYILLAQCLLSIVGSYYLMKYIYTHKIPVGLTQVWSWIIPGVNTMVIITGFLLCWNCFPICGLEYWKKRWDNKSSLYKPVKDLIADDAHL